ncbi:CRIB domain-containing protein RIC4-like protein [Carex littledalei]|uniref:CRIB domain-containing protein RIC4-like protein n=1 Tax=Carex littledalei TaxID=544730 RepID=A0A833RMI8_9POAL|nr:CRIB domain-containing protein RIC4-like protein [Carex littledalei]
MRDRCSDRFIVLPFSVSCVSQSSVSISNSKPKKQQQSEAQQTQPKSRETNGKAFQKPNISKLIKSFKSSLSHFLENLYKEDEEEEEKEMVIGYPTDVRHVTHVGVEGLNDTKQKELPEFLSLGCVPVPSLSVGQFEKAMEAQASADVGCSYLPRHHGQLGVVQV